MLRALECDIKLFELKTVARLSGNVCVSGCAAQHKYLHRLGEYMKWVSGPGAMMNANV
jgi:hypothetical protein